MPELKNNIVLVITTILFVIFLMWFLCPNSSVELPMTEQYKFLPEGYTQTTPVEMHANDPTSTPIAMGKPVVDPKSGSLVDGPGYDNQIFDDIPQQQTFSSIPSNYYFLDDGNNGNSSIMNNMCSPQCCASSWPVPFKQKYDPYICANKDKFVPSNYFCNNAFQSSGCLCMTKGQADGLSTRYGNAPFG